ncbi:MAG: polyprenyl diphosphate synthase, partial [Gammaproteobacteria bacterium]
MQHNSTEGQERITSGPVPPPATLALPLPARLLRMLRAVSHPLYWWYEQKLLAQVSHGRIPQHIGLILDGNRRFARGLGLDARKGHAFGVEKVHDLLEWCLELGISNVTLFVFSNENFERTPAEVEYLFDLFARESRKLIEHPRIQAHKVRVKVIGRRSQLPEAVMQASEALEKSTAGHDGMLLNIAFAYGGREEIVDAVKKLLLEADSAHRSPAEVAKHLTAAQISN